MMTRNGARSYCLAMVSQYVTMTFFSSIWAAGASIIYVLVILAYRAFTGSAGESIYVHWGSSFLLGFALMLLHGSINNDMVFMRRGFACKGVGVKFYLDLKFDESIPWLEKSVSFLRQTRGTKPILTELAFVLDTLGRTYWLVGNSEKALKNRIEAAQLLKQFIDTPSFLSEVLYGVGRLYAEQFFNHEAATLYFEEAIQVSRQVGYDWVEEACLDDLATIYQAQEDFFKALDNRLAALEFSKEDPSKKHSYSITLINLAELNRQIGNLPDALSLSSKTLEALEANIEDYSLKVVEACFITSAVLIEFDDCEQAEFILRRVKLISGPMAQKYDVAKHIEKTYETGMLYLGAIYCHTTISATWWHEYYEPISEALNYTKVIPPFPDALDLILFGELYDRSPGAEFRKSEEDALDEARSKDDQTLQLKYLRRLGTVHQELGNFNQSYQLHKSALELAESMGLTSQMIACELKLALIDILRKDKNAAVLHIDNAKLLIDKTKDWHLYIFFTHRAAFLYRKMGNWKEAIAFYQQMLEQAQNAGMLHRVVESLKFVGSMYEEQKLLPEAIISYQAALNNLGIFVRKLEQQLGMNSLIHIETLNLHLSLARCYSVQYNTDRIITEYESYITAAEAIRFRLDPRYKLRFRLKERAEAYMKTIELLHENKREPASILEMVERAKAAALLDQVGHKNFIDAVSVRSLSSKPLTPTSHVVTFALSTPEIQKFLRSQAKRILLIEYFCCSDYVLAFLMSSADSKPQCFKIPLSSVDIQKCVNCFIQEVAEPFQHGIEERQTWQDFAISLVNPFLEKIRTCDLLYLIPHGLLHYLPLHAIQAEGSYICQYCPIVYAPSASVARYCLRKQPRWETAMVIGFNGVDLQNAENEAETVATMFGSKPYVGIMAERQFLTQAYSKDVIHVACHGIFDSEQPLESGLLFSDGLVTVDRISEYRLDSNLVTLSACETGKSKIHPGDELVGFATELIRIGVQAVLVSLWKVDDQSTGIFMRKFYSLLRSKDSFIPKAEALQQAQIAFIQSPEKRWKHPYFWAPFIVIGDWR